MTEYVLKFTESEEKRIRGALVKFVERVSAGGVSTAETYQLANVLTIMYPGGGRTLSWNCGTSGD